MLYTIDIANNAVKTVLEKIMRKSDNVEKPEFVSNNEQVHYIGKGIECQVYEIVKEQLVCKIYDTPADARYNYILQRIAYRAGIGPEPLGLEKNYYFSRYIESYEKMDSMPGLLLWDIPAIHKTGFCKISKSTEYQELIDKVVDIFGGRWSDGHKGNIGLVFINGKHKYMIVDFGIAGFISTNLGSKLAKKLELSYD